MGDFFSADYDPSHVESPRSTRRLPRGTAIKKPAMASRARTGIVIRALVLRGGGSFFAIYLSRRALALEVVIYLYMKRIAQDDASLR